VVQLDSSQIHQLSAPGDEFPQFGLFLRVLSHRTRLDVFGEVSQAAGVNRIGFGDDPQPMREVTKLGGD
jgi:hypothetical protein